MPPARQSQLNTLLGSIGLLGILTIAWGTHRYLSPIEAVLPAVEKVEAAVESQAVAIQEISTTQRVQTEALKTLADVAKEGVEMRIDINGHDERIDHLEKRVDKIQNELRP